MIFTRRAFVRISLGSVAFAAAPRLLAQGVAVHTVKPEARPAPSGRPFDAHFVDVASTAGLQAPTIYGGVERKQYILETVGCGCRIHRLRQRRLAGYFFASGTPLEGAPPGASNRLYKNNRDGTFTDVTEKAGLRAWDGRPPCAWATIITTDSKTSSVTYWGQNVLYRNNGDGTFTDVTARGRLLTMRTRWGSGCTFIDYNRDGHLDLFVSQLSWISISSTVPKPGRTTNCNWKRRSCKLRAARTAHRVGIPLSQ